jgi:hypothetical protein
VGCQSHSPAARIISAARIKPHELTTANLAQPSFCGHATCVGGGTNSSVSSASVLSTAPTWEQEPRSVWSGTFQSPEAGPGASEPLFGEASAIETGSGIAADRRLARQSVRSSIPC